MVNLKDVNTGMILKKDSGGLIEVLKVSKEYIIYRPVDILNEYPLSEYEKNAHILLTECVKTEQYIPNVTVDEIASLLYS